MCVDRQYVDRVADMVRESMNLQVPIPMQSLCNSIESKLPGKCIPMHGQKSGKDVLLTIQEDGHFTIEYNEKKTQSYLLFLIAHELGHLFLHHLNDDGIFVPVDIQQEKSEREADEFAAAFLMPEKEFVKICDNGIINLTELTEYFHLSMQAVDTRGKVLGLW